MSLLEVRNLSKSFAGIQAVDAVSFNLEAGEKLAMIGPNGAGKSTCFNLLNGQLRPDSGSVLLSGTELSGLLPRQIYTHGLGRTFQITATFASMSVRENVQMALIFWHRKTCSLWPAAGQLYQHEANQLLARVGLAGQATRHAGILAYGDLKRLELAMALANEPRLLLLDEPVAGMPGPEREAMMDLIDEIVSSDGLSVLFTEHDMDAVFSHADRVLVLYAGEVLCSDSVAQIRENQRVKEVYLGGGSLYSGGQAGA